MDRISLSIEDVVHHVATFGLDIYPPIEITAERTRLNMFFEAAREKWHEIYEQLTASDTEFKISKRFRKDPQMAGPTIPLDTLVLTPRGPIFAFPLRLPDPVGVTQVGDTYCDLFAKVRKAFSSAVPGRTILRVGLVREVVFHTGKTNCTGLLSKQAEWCSAQLVGGSRSMQYRDTKCNVRLDLRPCEIMKTTQLPIGTRLDERVAYGLQVRLDVNNTDVRPLNEADIEEVVSRALGFWPNEVVEYLKVEGL